MEKSDPSFQTLTDSQIREGFLSDDEAVYRETRRSVVSMGRSSISALGTILAPAIVRLHRKGDRSILIRAIVWLTLAAFAFLQLNGATLNSLDITIQAYFCLFAMFFAYMGSEFALHRRRVAAFRKTKEGRVAQRAVEALIAIEDSATIGLLLETANGLKDYLDEQTYHQAMKILIRRLRSVRRDDATPLTSTQRDCLIRLFELHTRGLTGPFSGNQVVGKPLTECDAPLAEAIIMAAECIGDVRIADHIRSLAAIDLSVSGTVGQTARAYLPRLRSESAVKAKPDELLRPASEPKDRGATLLRPAAPAAYPADNLLRPAASNEEAETNVRINDNRDRGNP